MCLIWTVSAMFSVHIMSYFDAWWFYISLCFEIL